MTRLEQAATDLLAAIRRGECRPTPVELYALATIVGKTGNHALTLALIRAARAQEPRL